MEESVLLSAATAYMDVSRDTANPEVQQNNLRVLRRTLKDTRNRIEAGQVTAIDVAQSEAQLAAGEASLHAAENATPYHSAYPRLELRRRSGFRGSAKPRAGTAMLT
jgi:outer membrane protein TolC